MILELKDNEELDDLGEISSDGKGVYTWKYKVRILGDKKVKNKPPKEFDL